MPSTAKPMNLGLTHHSEQNSIGELVTRAFPIEKRDSCDRAKHMGCPGANLVLNFPGATPPTNGCGPAATSILQQIANDIIDQPWAHECCVGHDTCYHTCSNSFDTCNGVFLDCLLNACGAALWFGCDVVAHAYHAAVASSTACSDFLDDGETFCHCPWSWRCEKFVKDGSIVDLFREWLSLVWAFSIKAVHIIYRPVLKGR